MSGPAWSVHWIDRQGLFQWRIYATWRQALDVAASQSQAAHRKPVVRRCTAEGNIKDVA
jgi:hypothetical protein